MSYNAPPPPPPGTSSKAVWSLVLGLLGIVCCGLFTGIPALFLGRSAQREIEQTGQGGAGMAKAGFILGIIAILFTVVQVILFATGVLEFGTDLSSTN